MSDMKNWALEELAFSERDILNGLTPYTAHADEAAIPEHQETDYQNQAREHEQDS